jgi:hypothetical protein
VAPHYVEVQDLCDRRDDLPLDWVESLRKKLPEDSCCRRWFDTAACPVAEPSEFTDAEDELAS